MQTDAQLQPDNAAPRARRSRTRRALRALGWTVSGLLALMLVAGAGAWWWLGSNQSLDFELARVELYLPAGQSI